MRPAIILILFVLCACSKDHDEDLYLGDLSFDIFRMGSFYNLPDSLIRRIESGMDTTDLDNANGDEITFLDIFNKLKQQNLLYKPFVDLRPKDENSLITLYLDSADYDQIKRYKRKDLHANKKKVAVWGKTKKIGHLGQVTFLYCTDLVKVELVDGNTFPLGNDKFKIEDYE